MNDIRNYLVTLPRDVLSKVSIEDNRVIIPADIDAGQFCSLLSNHIFTDGLNTEKGIYASLGIKESKLESIDKLLSNK